MNGQITRRGFLGGAVLLGGAALVGCAPGQEAARPGTIQQAAVADGAPRRGGRLRLGVVDGDRAGTLDAHKPLTIGSIIRGFAVYSKLWEWDAEMNWSPALAEETEANADATTWTVRLRQGLEFHNGKTITADDVIFSARRLTDPALGSPWAALLFTLDRERIDKVDERTVRFHFKDGKGFVPFPDTFTNFGAVVPVDYDPARPVGAGPYKLKEFTPGRRSLFTRFENYFKDGRPYADELEIIDFQDEASRIAALQAGQISLANGIGADQVRLLQGDPRVRVVVSETSNWQSFDLNLSKEPFRDERVREAFRLLTDRQELVDRALSGHGRLANDLYSPQDPTFDRSIPQRPHDVERARALLKEAGRENLQIELVSGEGGDAAALVFAAQAKKAGITVTVKKVDAATFNGPRRLDWTMSTGGLLTESFLSSALHLDAPVSAANKTHFSDPRFTELFEQAVTQPDTARRAELVHEMQRIQHAKGGMVIWGFNNALDAVSTGVGGVTPEHTQFATWRFEKLWVKETT
ncbi:ABC transporter substrate-binding protein [Streptosporangium sp. NPDC020072]|uniref:ABC transporter substrate-binding protein n=1 Tax=unclassified Streptosporangium TaxID=2632669 RepID=UPI00332E3FF6